MHGGVVNDSCFLLLLFFPVTESAMSSIQRGKAKMKMGGKENASMEGMKQRTSRVRQVNYHFKRRWLAAGCSAHYWSSVLLVGTSHIAPRLSHFEIY